MKFELILLEEIIILYLNNDLNDFNKTTLLNVAKPVAGTNYTIENYQNYRFLWVQLASDGHNGFMVSKLIPKHLYSNIVDVNGAVADSHNFVSNNYFILVQGSIRNGIIHFRNIKYNNFSGISLSILGLYPISNK